MTDVTKQLSEFAANLKHEEIPVEVAERAKLLALDLLGIALRARFDADSTPAMMQAAAKLWPGGGERRPLGDAMAAHLAEYRFRGIGQPGRLGLQFRRREEAGRYAEAIGRRQHRRLVGLDVEGGQAGHGLARQAGFGEAPLHQIRQFLRRGTPLAADPDGEHGRMHHQIVPRIGHRPIGDAQPEAAFIRERSAGFGKP